jgi:hypothetical protein
MVIFGVFPVVDACVITQSQLASENVFTIHLNSLLIGFSSNSCTGSSGTRNQAIECDKHGFYRPGTRGSSSSHSDEKGMGYPATSQAWKKTSN